MVHLYSTTTNVWKITEECQVAGTDYVSFSCAGAPAFELKSQGWAYENYAWHTNLDTFDKLVFDELKNNAVLVAILAYLASEDPQRVPRQAPPTDPKTGKSSSLPVCIPPARNWAQRRH